MCLNNAAPGNDYMTEKEMLAAISTKLDLLMEYNKDDHGNIFKRLGILEQQSCPFHGGIVDDINELKVADEKIKGDIDTSNATMVGKVKVLAVKLSVFATFVTLVVVALVNKAIKG